MSRNDIFSFYPKVSEGASPPAEEIPRKRGRPRPGRAAARPVCKVGDGSELRKSRSSMTEKRTIKSMEIEYMPIF